MRGSTIYETEKEVTIEDEGERLLLSAWVRVEASCYYDPGKLSGPPGDCYPEEGGVNSATIEIIEAYDEEGEILTSPGLIKQIREALNEEELEDEAYAHWQATAGDEE